MDGATKGTLNCEWNPGKNTLVGVEQFQNADGSGTLSDRGYPGNYYTLTFDSERNRLVGVYHHLELNQNLSVYFIRR